MWLLQPPEEGSPASAALGGDGFYACEQRDYVCSSLALFATILVRVAAESRITCSIFNALFIGLLIWLVHCSLLLHKMVLEVGKIAFVGAVTLPLGTQHPYPNPHPSCLGRIRNYPSNFGYG